MLLPTHKSHHKLNNQQTVHDSHHIAALVHICSMGQQHINDLVVVFRGSKMQGGQAVMDPFVDGGALVMQEGSEGPQLAPGGGIVVGHVGVLVLSLGVSSSGQKRSHNLLHIAMYVLSALCVLSYACMWMYGLLQTACWPMEFVHLFSGVYVLQLVLVQQHDWQPAKQKTGLYHDSI